MIVRPITRDDYTQHMITGAQAFIFKTLFDDKDEFDPTGIYAAFDNDNKTIMAQIETLEFESSFCGTYLKSRGVGGVASRPEFRRKGCVRAIFDELLNVGRERGEAVSILYPFSYDYYRKFGYESVFHAISIKAPFTCLSNIERCCDVALYTPDKLSEVLKIYDEYATTWANLMFRRSTDKYFDNKPFENLSYTYIWYSSDGEPRSYVSYEPDRANSTIVVNELIFTDKASLLGIMGFLRTYDGNYNFIRFYKIPVLSPVLELFTEYTKMEMKYHHKGSGRIIDIEKVLEANKYPRESGSFTILCEDICEWNNGIFCVEYEDGKAQITRKTGGNYDLKLNINAASRLMLAGEGLSGGRLEYVPGVEMKNNAEGFTRAFPQRMVDIYEKF